MDLGQCPFATGVHDLDAIHERMRLRGNGVHSAELPDGSPVWVVTGYRAVTGLLADPNVSAAKADSTTGFRGNRLPPALDANLLNVDGDTHRRLRRLGAAGFGPAQRHHQEQVVLGTVADLVDRLPAAGLVDFMAGLCEPLPVRVTGTLLGLPDEQLDAFRDASAPLLRADASHEPDMLSRSMAALLALITAAIAGKRERPGDDLLSAWIAARDGADRLTEDELTSLAFITVIGGFENTISLIALVLDELVRHHQPQAREMLDRPVEFAELIRRLVHTVAPMSFAVRRFPLTDIEINGVPIPKGHTVIASLRSARLDPEAHGRPEPTFGHGRHYCLGANLAELQARHAAQAVLRKYSTIEVIGPRDSYALRDSWITYALAELTLRAG
ncbi:cytochrome P450 family protein [Nocardia stercoris]|uniref:Cytochrome P450 n=1 Tax=Nocardia stercoris TaxID=2483361 RepID=A0A3M2L218_9NOCA|nr:cytochrome P450 [Nocardia stercoris]RMI30563.1 cytochrome P450 [Nocardia stercoris]